MTFRSDDHAVVLGDIQAYLLPLLARINGCLDLTNARKRNGDRSTESLEFVAFAQRSRLDRVEIQRFREVFMPYDECIQKIELGRSGVARRLLFTPVGPKNAKEFIEIVLICGQLQICVEFASRFFHVCVEDTGQGLEFKLKRRGFLPPP